MSGGGNAVSWARPVPGGLPGLLRDLDSSRGVVSAAIGDRARARPLRSGQVRRGERRVHPGHRRQPRERQGLSRARILPDPTGRPEGGARRLRQVRRARASQRGVVELARHDQAPAQGPRRRLGRHHEGHRDFPPFGNGLQQPRPAPHRSWRPHGGDRRLRPVDCAQSQAERGVQQPRHRQGEDEGCPRRHRRLHPGHRDRSNGCRRVRQPRGQADPDWRDRRSPAGCSEGALHQSHLCVRVGATEEAQRAGDAGGAHS